MVAVLTQGLDAGLSARDDKGESVIARHLVGSIVVKAVGGRKMKEEGVSQRSCPLQKGNI